MEQVTETLRRIAAAPELHVYGPQLNRLALALEGTPAERRKWGSLDLFHAFTPSMLYVAPSEGPLQRALEVAQRVLVFCPVLWTWVSLSFAVGAYDDLIRSTPTATGEPFLSLWQQGFGEALPSLMRLKAVGLIDALLIVLLLIATAMSYCMAQRSERLALETQEAMAGELHAALMEAALYLAVTPLDAEDQVRARLIEAAGTLEQASTGLAGVTTAASDVVGVLNEGAEALATASAEAAGAGRSSADAALSVSKTTAKLTSLLSSLEGDTKRLTSAMQASSTEGSQAANVLASAAIGTTEAASKVVDGVKDINEQVRALKDELSPVLNELSRDRIELQTSIRKFSRAVDNLGKWAPQFESSVGTLAEATQLLVDDEVAATLRKTVATLQVGIREIRSELNGLRPEVVDALRPR